MKNYMDKTSQHRFTLVVISVLSHCSGDDGTPWSKHEGRKRFKPNVSAMSSALLLVALPLVPSVVAEADTDLCTVQLLLAALCGADGHRGYAIDTHQVHTPPGVVLHRNRGAGFSWISRITVRINGQTGLGFCRKWFCRLGSSSSRCHINCIHQ